MLRIITNIAAEVVNQLNTSYPRRMEEISRDTLKVIAQSHGLELTDDEIARMLPLVRNALALLVPVRAAIQRETEPVAPSAEP